MIRGQRLRSKNSYSSYKKVHPTFIKVYCDMIHRTDKPFFSAPDLRGVWLGIRLMVRQGVTTRGLHRDQWGVSLSDADLSWCTGKSERIAAAKAVAQVCKLAGYSFYDSGACFFVEVENFDHETKRAKTAKRKENVWLAEQEALLRVTKEAMAKMSAHVARKSLRTVSRSRKKASGTRVTSPS